MTNQVQAWVSAAVRALRSGDRQQIVDSFESLAGADPDHLLRELLLAVDEGAAGDPEADVPRTELLPDPEQSKALLRAVIAQDDAAILSWASDDYANMVTGLASLAAALRIDDLA